MDRSCLVNDGPGNGGPARSNLGLDDGKKKLIRCAPLPPNQRAQVLFNCGGILTPDRLETVLRTTFPKLHDMEKRMGPTAPSALKRCCHGFPKRKSPPEADLEVEQEDVSEDDDLAEWVVPLTMDLIDAHCSHSGVRASFMWTVPSRLDRTQQENEQDQCLCDRAGLRFAQHCCLH